MSTEALFVPHQIPRTTLIQDAQFLLDFLEKYAELDPNRCSRFSQMAKAVCAGESNLIPASRPDFPLIIQANRDLIELVYIFKVLEPTPAKQELWDRTQRLFSDTPLPSKSTGRSDSRNTQFELLSEAMLTRAGLEPVHVARDAPDFLCRLEKREFVVEAKMARSTRAVRRELLHAADQIERSGKPGLIFLDWTFAMNSDSPDHFFASKQRIPSIGEAQVKRYLYVRKAELKRVESQLAAKRVLGVTYVDRLVLQDGFNPSTQMGNWQLVSFRDQQELLPRRFPDDKKIVDTAFQLLADLGLPIPLERPDEDLARSKAAGVVIARPPKIVVPAHIWDPRSAQRNEGQ